MTANPQGTVDTLDFDRAVEFAAQPGPKATFYVPTEVQGTTADKSAVILSNQLKEAASRLTASGMDETDVDAVLAPVRELTSDSSYWRQQSRGLVVFAGQGFFQSTRIPITVTDSVTVADNFHLMPLVPVLEKSGKAYVLALSKNSVRLFDATRNSIEQLPQGDIPSDFEDAIGELPEPQLQHRPVGGGQASFHGHGGADETDTMLTEKFLRRVGEAVGKHLGTARSQPLVLASVAEYLPVFRKVCPYPVIHDEVIAGNPEHTNPHDLRSAAWRLLEKYVAKVETDDAERALSMVHNGKGSLDPAEIVHAAGEGRVDTLYFPRSSNGNDNGNGAGEGAGTGEVAAGPAADGLAANGLADQAITATLTSRGSVRTLGDWQWSERVIATFRY